MKQTKFIIVGDPIEDIYLEASTGNNTVVPGGASNVYHNAKEILKSTPFHMNVHFIPKINSTKKHLYKILRIDSAPDIQLSSQLKKENYYSDLKYDVQKQLNDSIDRISYSSVILFSDYNKGILNTPAHRYKGIPKIELAVVDSKYRSLHETFFDFADNYIWRCTGNEYDVEFAKKFKYTVWTDANNPIVLLDQNQEILKIFQVPQVEPIDTCGAGDTFTATFTAYLFAKGLTLKNIEKAIELSIESSIEVITKHKTSITNIKI